MRPSIKLWQRPRWPDNTARRQAPASLNHGEIQNEYHPICRSLPRKSSVFLRLVALRNGFQPCRHCWKGLGRVFQCRVQLMWSNNLCTLCRFTLLLRGPRSCNLVTNLHPTIRQKRHLGHCYSPDLSGVTFPRLEKTFGVGNKTKALFFTLFVSLFFTTFVFPFLRTSVALCARAVAKCAHQMYRSVIDTFHGLMAPTHQKPDAHCLEPCNKCADCCNLELQRHKRTLNCQYVRATHDHCDLSCTAPLR